MKRKAGKLGGILSVVSFADAQEQDRAYWLKQSPQARLRAMEVMRRINYGKAAAG